MGQTGTVRNSKTETRQNKKRGKDRLGAYLTGTAAQQMWIHLIINIFIIVHIL